jgi:hypothetical protein
MPRGGLKIPRRVSNIRETTRQSGAPHRSIVLSARYIPSRLCVHGATQGRVYRGCDASVSVLKVEAGFHRISFAAGRI